MEDDYLEKLYDLGDPQLLHIVAFKLTEYVPEAREVLQTILKERGFSTADVCEYRELYLGRDSLGIACDSCGVELILERKDLNSGSYTCPSCTSQSLITYPEKSYRTPREAVGEEVFDEEVVEETSTPEQPETEEDETVEGEATSAEEITEGDSLVTCFQCGKELQNDEVFVSEGEFYCEQCFGKQIAVSGTPPEESPDDGVNPS
jgi:Zn finger protein HypA/HybF involved in hydrogenase expression